MPPRRGRAQPKARREVEWSPAVALALTGCLAGAQPSERALRAAWHRERAFLIASAPDVATLTGFWRFERGIPAGLRVEPPLAYALEDRDRIEAERDRLHTHRRAFLAEHPPVIA